MTALDEDFLESHARAQQLAAWTFSQGSDLCGACRHRWHGLPCTSDNARGPCPCASAFPLSLTGERSQP